MGDEIEEDGEGVTYSTIGGDKNLYGILFGKPERKIPIRRDGRRLKVNILIVILINIL